MIYIPQSASYFTCTDMTPLIGVSVLIRTDGAFHKSQGRIRYEGRKLRKCTGLVKPQERKKKAP